MAGEVKVTAVIRGRMGPERDLVPAGFGGNVQIFSALSSRPERIIAKR
jgi:hypothetical protein